MISPIRYMGNKNQLINKGLIDLFPKDIKYMYDLFGGSGTVSLNTISEEYILNEKDKNIYLLYDMFKNNHSETIIECINSFIENYDMPRFSTDIRRRDITKDIRDYYKNNYMIMREEFNNELSPIKILVLMYYSMSTTIRINDKNKYNMPFGNGYFIEDKHGEQIRDFQKWFQNNQVKIYNKDYREISICDDNAFVYLDPPYLNTIATYTENDKWNIRKQQELLNYCDRLNSLGVKFGLSNTFHNKGIENTVLIEWVKEKKYKVHHFENFDYVTFGTGKSNTTEIYIYNY